MKGENTMIEAGKKYIITEKIKDKIRMFSARINYVEDRGEYFYIGYTPDDFIHGRFGAFRYYKDGQERPVMHYIQKAN